VILFLLFS